MSDDEEYLFEIEIEDPDRDEDFADEVLRGVWYVMASYNGGEFDTEEEAYADAIAVINLICEGCSAEDAVQAVLGASA